MINDEQYANKICKAFIDTLKRHYNYKEFINLVGDPTLHISQDIFKILVEFNIIQKHNKKSDVGFFPYERPIIWVLANNVSDNVIRLPHAEVSLLTDEEYLIKNIIE